MKGASEAVVSALLNAYLEGAKQANTVCRWVWGCVMSAWGMVRSGVLDVRVCVRLRHGARRLWRAAWRPAPAQRFG